MKSRDAVIANIECRSTGRIAFNFARVPGRMNDFVSAGCGHGIERERWEGGGFEFSTDIWGNIWRRIPGKSQSGEIWKPVLEDWSDLDSLELPELDASEYYEEARRLGKEENEKFRYGHFWGIGWVFTIPQSLRRMDTLFMDFIEHPDRVEALLGRIVPLLEGMIRRYGEAGLDGIMFGEDLGVQDRLLFGRMRWNSIFRHHYERLTSCAHSFGMKVIQHTCGYNWELIDDLCDAGVDCLQFDQPTVYDMQALAAKLRDHGVGLFSPCDIQGILPTGDRGLIERECRKIVELFKGGFIAKNYPDLHGIGVEEEWDEWAYRAFVEYGTSG